MSAPGRILLIEDHTPSREIMKKALEKVGHAVADFPSGRDAVEYLRTVAFSRLVLDNIPNIQASWVTMGMKIGAVRNPVCAIISGTCLCASDSA